jgi:AraC-like DNA-binding protein
VVFAPENLFSVSQSVASFFRVNVAQLGGQRSLAAIKTRWHQSRSCDEAGISLRYLRKLFIARGTTCSRFIQSVRLDQASHLLRRRVTMKARHSLSEIAHSCGFLDCTNLDGHRFSCPARGDFSSEQVASGVCAKAALASLINCSLASQATGQRI